MRGALIVAIACGAPPPPISNTYTPTGPKSASAIVPGASIAGVLIGATRAQVEAALGKPTSVDKFDDSFYLEYATRGLSFAFPTADGVVGWEIAYSGRVGGYEKGEFGRFDGTTPEGVGVDATEDDVRRIYGPPDKQGDLSMAPVPSNWLTYDRRGLGFDFITATHRMITISVMRPAPD